MAANVYGRGLTGLIKRGWNEVPEVVFGCFAAVVGSGLSYRVYLKDRNAGLEGHKFKMRYTIRRRSDVAEPNNPGYN